MDKKKRLALDVIGQLEDELEQNPLDYNKWNKLIKQVVAKDKEEQIRKTFEKYLSIFKLDGKQWCNYISFEMGRQEFVKVQQLFSQCITLVDNVELFRLYVSYVRRVNDVITGGEKARGIVIQAFDFAVNRVGIDLKSGDLWTDYLEFLKSWTPSASWEQQQKTDLIRKVYKKLLVVPTEKVEGLWAGYTRWENEINGATASRHIADKSAEFMEARSWNTEWHNITKNQLRRDLVPQDISSEVVKIQLNLWFKWIEFEKRNSLDIKDELVLNQRIEYAYKQLIMSLPFVPELWYNYNTYLKTKGGSISCMDLLLQALILNPKSYLLSFEMSELYERENSLDKANETLQLLTNNLVKEYDEYRQKIESINEKINTKPVEVETNNDSDDDEPKQKPPQIQQLSEPDIRSLKLCKSQCQKLALAVTIVYTKLMMTNKRSSGIKESRQIFKQAKKFSGIGHELYVENALMEYYSDNKNIARKVFELGMKSYGSDGGYLLAYLDFLMMANEIESIKVLFEIAMTNLTKIIDDNTIKVDEMDTPSWVKEELKSEIKTLQTHVKKLITKYSRFATKFLDLGIVSSLELRYRELFPDDDPITLLASRYAYNQYDFVSEELDREPPTEKKDEEPDTKKRKLALPSKPVRNEESINAVSQQQSQQQGFITNSIYNLLRVLPNASYFGEERVFNSHKLVELFSTMD